MSVLSSSSRRHVLFQITKYIFGDMNRKNGPTLGYKFRRDGMVNRRTKMSSTVVNRKEKVEILPSPIKSESDPKLYKTIRLQNGLTALLISDIRHKPPQDELMTEAASENDSGNDSSWTSDESDEDDEEDLDDEKLAACALTVNVGSFSDPMEIQGLAHFVEHMVFMGSEKYPKENEFDAFIKKKGGLDNASTDCESTTFYFAVPEKNLQEAMDIFSNFFVSPLMKKEAMQREREAIESEFGLGLPSESNRKYQLLGSLFPPQHPARIFTWGDLRSLKDDIENDDVLHKAAHEFRRKHYSAHRMTLAIQARLDLDQLEQYTINTFSRIKNNGLDPTDYKAFNYTKPVAFGEFPGLFFIKPIGDTTELQLTFCLPPLLNMYKSKPEHYLSHLLGHEGPGSLLSYLRKKVWALSVSSGNSGSGMDFTSIYSLFTVQVTLTNEGFQHYQQVIEAIFSYINMIKKLGPSKRIYDELKAIESYKFKFIEESEPEDYVEEMSVNMHYYPPEHYIIGDHLFLEYDAQAITNLLEYMTPHNVNIMVLSEKNDGVIDYNEKEKWFGTKFARKALPKDLVETWAKVEPYPSFHLPEPNPYIATDFELIQPPSAYNETAEILNVDLKKTSMKELYKKSQKAPVQKKVLRKGALVANVNNFRLDQPNLIRKNEYMEVWYKPDFKFRLPTALLYFYFISPLTMKSPRDACLLDLWNDILKDDVKEQLYPATMAAIGHTVYVGEKGLLLNVGGYSQHLSSVVKLITQAMRTSADKVTPEMLNAFKEIRNRFYHNILLKPKKLAKEMRIEALIHPFNNIFDRAAVLNDITLEELRGFINRYLDNIYMNVLVQGNEQWDNTILLAEDVLSNLKYKPISEDQYPKLSVREIPQGVQIVNLLSLNQQSTNNIVVNYYQAGVSNPKTLAILDLLSLLMEEPLFDTLRTKEQLGYSVSNSVRYTYGVLGYSVIVNSQDDKFSVSEVDARIEAFLKTFARSMSKLSAKKLSDAKASLIHLKHLVHVDIKDEAENNWREIINEERNFQRDYEEIEVLRSISVADVKEYVEKNFDAQMRRKLSVQVSGHLQNETTPLKVPDDRYTYVTPEVSTPGVLYIKDVNEYKDKLHFYNITSAKLDNC